MDLVSWLLSNGAVVRKGGKEYCVNCPRCGDVKKHLYVNPEKGVAHCFRCGYSGKIEEVLIDAFGLSLSDVRELLREVRVQKGLEYTDLKEINFPDGSLDFEKVGIGVRKLLEGWCKENNIKFEDLIRIKCRWWSGRLIVPCWKDKNRSKLWYWVARAIGDVEPKYLNCPASRTGVVWGIDWYDVSDGYLYVCEGWKDAYRMRGIALLGKEVSNEQIDVIRMLSEGRKVRVLLDSDAWREGIMVGVKIGREVGIGNVEVGFLFGLKDPGEGKEKEEVLKNTVFVNVGEGVGNLIELMSRLKMKLIEEKLSVQKV